MPDETEIENGDTATIGETGQEVYEDLIATMNDLAGAHSLAVIAMALMADNLEHLEPPNVGEDSLFLFGAGESDADPDQPGFAYQRWKFFEMPEKLSPEGPVFLALGRQWLITAYTEWEDNFRPRFARAGGVDKGEVTDLCFGDLRLLRNDVIHNRGIAGEKYAREANNQWFDAGDEIRIYPQHVSQVMEYLGVNESLQSIVDEGPWDAYYVDLSPNEED